MLTATIDPVALGLTLIMVGIIGLVIVFGFVIWSATSGPVGDHRDRKRRRTPSEALSDFLDHPDRYE